MAKKPTNTTRSPSSNAGRATGAAAKLEQAKLAAMKELAYGASHEINNPLANIVTRAQTLLRNEADPEKRRMLAAIHAQALRAHEMIADLMLFARPPQLACEWFEVVPWLERVLDETRSEAHDREIAATITLDLPSDAREVALEADPVQLAVALRGVLRNSLDALNDAGQILVGVKFAEQQIVFTVCDSGQGIPPEVLPHVFEPFYSGREAGRGLGFGLAKAWRIITDHGGTIAIADPTAGRTTVEIALPAAALR
jgi:signal transduction histidine kinase